MNEPYQSRISPDAPEPAQKPPALSGTQAFARWLSGAQRRRTRHDTITRDLGSWSNYQSWAEKMRDDWGSGKS